MYFVINNIYLKICFEVFGDVRFRVFCAHETRVRASHLGPDLLEFTAGSVSLVVTLEM